MNKNIYFILLLLLVFSCYTAKEVNKTELLYYGKTRCLGKCPVFDMYIYNDGKIVYEGFENVTIVGKKEYLIPREKLDFLKKELDKIDFSNKTNLKRDLPNTVIKYKNQKLLIQNKEDVKTLLNFLGKIAP